MLKPNCTLRISRDKKAQNQINQVQQKTERERENTLRKLERLNSTLEKPEQTRISINVLNSVLVNPSKDASPFSTFVISFVDNEGKSKSTVKRYREILVFHEQMVKNFPKQSFPAFPPKKIIGNLDPVFIETRRTALDTYFQKFAALPDEITSSKILEAFFDEKSN